MQSNRASCRCRPAGQQLDAGPGGSGACRLVERALGRVPRAGGVWRIVRLAGGRHKPSVDSVVPGSRRALRAGVACEPRAPVASPGGGRPRSRGVAAFHQPGAKKPTPRFDARDLAAGTRPRPGHDPATTRPRAGRAGSGLVVAMPWWRCVVRSLPASRRDLGRQGRSGRVRRVRACAPPRPRHRSIDPIHRSMAAARRRGVVSVACPVAGLWADANVRHDAKAIRLLSHAPSAPPRPCARRPNGRSICRTRLHPRTED